MLPLLHTRFLKDVAKFTKFSVKSISTNPAKRTTEAISASKRDDYYKNLGESADAGDVKPPGWDEARPFDSIPGPKPLPLLGNAWRFLPYVGEFYNLTPRELYQSMKDKYGEVVILKGIPGRNPMVILFNVEDMEMAFRNEGPYPIRVVAESSTYYRTVLRKDVFKGFAGVATVQGEEWFKFRSKVNPILMQPKIVKQYSEKMDKVASELIDNIRYFSTKNENNEMPDDFQGELYKWALESVGLVALDKHLGCLNLNAPKDSESNKLISSVIEMFLLMYKLDILPPIWKFIETPSWKRYVKVLDYITEVTSKYIQEAMDKVIDENIPEHELSVTQRLAKQDKAVAIATVMDMLIAGIDTTGKSMATTLYFLARNPDKQQILREEVLKNLPEKNSPVTKEVLNNSPYLKAVIKESTRIAPVAIGNIRTSIKDLVLGGYQVPKDSVVLMSNITTSNSEIFKDHTKFMPERWLRTTEDEYSHKNAHPFAYMPFGFGPRSCIGKRLANLELEVALAKIIRNFELSWHYEDMVFSGQLLYGIDGPLKLRVKET